MLVVDNIDPYYDRRIKESNLASVRESPGAGFIEEDVGNREFLNRLFQGKGFETVFHLAAKTGVRPSVAEPRPYFEVNVGGTANLLEASCRGGAGRFAFASSSSVYGNNGKVPFSEADPAETPLSPYGASRRAAEIVGRAYVSYPLSGGAFLHRLRTEPKTGHGHPSLCGASSRWRAG